MFPIFTLFGRTVGMYGVCAMLGFLAAGAIGAWLGRRFQMEIEDIILLFLVAAGGLLLGGHLLYALVNLQILTGLLSQIGQLSFSEIMTGLGRLFGGNVFYGGMLGAALALFLYGKHQKAGKDKHFLDIFGVAAPLFHVFGRIGCFFGGCCYGIESPIGFTVFNNALIPSINGVCRFPVSLLEAGCNLLIFLFVLQCFRKERFSGKLFALYLALYAPIRFGTEFLRGDEMRGIFFGFSTSQWISLLILLCLAVWRLKRFCSAKREKRVVAFRNNP